MNYNDDKKQEVIEQIESLGLEACTNLDRLNFELFKKEQELLILNSKQAYFKEFPNSYLKTRMGSFISSSDKDHSDHAKIVIQEQIKVIKKEIKKEKISQAFAPEYENYLADEYSLRLIKPLAI